MENNPKPITWSITQLTCLFWCNPLRLAFLMSASLLAGAYAFEYIGGLIPCDLCWPQRYAHMAILGLSAAGLLLGKASNLLHGLLAWGTALALGVSTALSGYHAGVEQKWWKGPDTCTSDGQDMAVDMESLFDGMMESRLVMCDDIAWEMFGISMAGYNFLISTAVALFVTAALVAKLRKKS